MLIVSSKSKCLGADWAQTVTFLTHLEKYQDLQNKEKKKYKPIRGKVRSWKLSQYFRNLLLHLFYSGNAKTYNKKKHWKENKWYCRLLKSSGCVVNAKTFTYYVLRSLYQNINIRIPATKDWYLSFGNQVCLQTYFNPNKVSSLFSSYLGSCIWFYGENLVSSI